MTQDEMSQRTEGTTTVFVYDKDVTSKGPGSKQGLPFYNPAMELNRDCSIAVGQWLLDRQQKPLHFFDGLSASGIRGVRFLNELKGEFEVTLNDWSDDAYTLLQRNLNYYSFSNGHAAQENIHTLLASHRYDYVDIDPFGTPTGYIDSAIRGCKHDGILAVSATDTATLCGTYPKVCRRRYFAAPYHGFVMHEVGLRILLGFLGREAAKHDKGITQLLCYSTDHYMRIYIQVHNNINSANETIEKIQTISSKTIYPFEKEKEHMIGPLWVGKLHNTQAIREIRSIVLSKTLGTKNTLIRLLDLLEDESVAPMFFYTSDRIASHLKCSPPPLDLLMRKIEDAGFKAYRTHFSPTGFKTLAPASVIEKLFLELQ
jgi:tRNA (guanine26-N2/guanine27-N2)-dimethyltransferase